MFAKRLVTFFTFGWAFASTIWAFSRSYSKETTEQIAVIQNSIQNIEHRLNSMEEREEKLNERILEKR